MVEQKPYHFRWAGFRGITPAKAMRKHLDRRELLLEPDRYLTLRKLATGRDTWELRVFDLQLVFKSGFRHVCSIEHLLHKGFHRYCTFS